MYHRVVRRAGSGRLRLVAEVELERFKHQLGWLRSHYTVVPLPDLTQAVERRRPGQPFPIALTFDDDLSSHARLAAPALLEFGLPATFFICGATLSAPDHFWLERLESAGRESAAWPELVRELGAVLGSELDPSIGAAEFIDRVKKMSFDERERLSDQIDPLVGPDPPDSGLRTEDVRFLAASGFEIGFHTLRHELLPNLQPNALRSALREGRSELEALVGQPLTAIAYPYCAADEMVAKETRSAGYRLGLTCQPIAVTPASDRMLLGRIDPSSISLGHFALQIARALDSDERRSPLGGETLPAGATVEQLRHEDAGYPERIVPDSEKPGVLAVHLARYRFAEPWCRGRVVLDAACGVGYGAALLARTAREVVGVDSNSGAIAYAEHRYNQSGAMFLEMDVQDLRFGAATFEVVCSFETIEHVRDVDRYLAEIRRVLTRDGTLLVSTPRADETTYAPENPHHLVEFSEDDFRALLAPHFEDIQIYGQRRRFSSGHEAIRQRDVLGFRKRLPLPLRRFGARALGTPSESNLKVEDVIISRGRRDEATELVAICSSSARS